MCILLDYEEKTLASKRIYDGRILQLNKDQVLLPNGEQADREVIHHHGGVCILAQDTDGSVLFVRQFRYPYHRLLLELPAGKLEPGENPLICGKRELQEETGATAEQFTSLGEFYPSCGYTDEVIYLYFAEGLRFGKQHLDADEFLDVLRIPLEKAVSMILAGEVPDGKTQSAVLQVYLRQKGQINTK
ncbi:MAG TPA: ADP-ribose pyrophosphatase [Ruminococcaceae bacterium]|nr:ADP-ribose pyrophosphatase [Oscillospiraceae bacterium]